MVKTEIPLMSQLLLFEGPKVKQFQEYSKCPTGHKWDNIMTSDGWISYSLESSMSCGLTLYSLSVRQLLLVVKNEEHSPFHNYVTQNVLEL